MRQGLPGSSAAQSSRRASPWSTRTGSPSTASRSAGTSDRSASTATTSDAAPARATVSDPSPAPISTTRSPGRMPASATMARARFGSIRKFCPNDLDGMIPWRRARSRTSAAPSPAAGLPDEPDLADALGERRDEREGVTGEVDDAPAERSTVVDYHGDRLPVGQVGDRDARSERERGMRGRQSRVAGLVPRGLDRSACCRSAGGGVVGGGGAASATVSGRAAEAAVPRRSHAPRRRPRVVVPRRAPAPPRGGSRAGPVGPFDRSGDARRHDPHLAGGKADVVDVCSPRSGWPCRPSTSFRSTRS